MGQGQAINWAAVDVRERNKRQGRFIFDHDDNCDYCNEEISWNRGAMMQHNSKFPLDCYVDEVHYNVCPNRVKKQQKKENKPNNNNNNATRHNTTTKRQPTQETLYTEFGSDESVRAEDLNRKMMTPEQFAEILQNFYKAMDEMNQNFRLAMKIAQDVILAQGRQLQKSDQVLADLSKKLGSYENAELEHEDRLAGFESE